MAVGSWRRLLLLANLAALFVLLASLLGTWRHHRAMDTESAEIVFGHSRHEVADEPVRIGDIGMQFGRYASPQKPGDPRPRPPAPPSALKDLGRVLGGVCIDPPYDGKAPWPTLVWRFRDGRTKIVRLGDTVVDGRFRFLGCDGEEFLFDGARLGIQKAADATDSKRRLLPVESRGVFTFTPDAVRHVRKRYPVWLKQVRTVPLRDPATGRPLGLLVKRVQPGSEVRRFGIRADDLVLSINGRPVTKQAQIVRIVKEELRKKVRFIEAKIRRNGRIVVQRYDTRDPATRRRFREAR